MKKIGFIDYFLDNFHANSYPDWIKEYSEGEFCVTSAWAMAECPREGAMTNEEWSKKHGIKLCKTEEEVINESDFLMVLSPSHPEMHEELCQKALRSGKRVYVDKAFAPDLAAAKRIFSLADEHNTPCCSSSALAFVSAYEKIEREKIKFLSSKGGGTFEVYAIHQLEPLISLMDDVPTEIMSVGDKMHPAFILVFKDGRSARMEQLPGQNFEICAGYKEGGGKRAVAEEEIFKNFIYKVIDFFKTGELVATHKQTLSVISALDAAKKALDAPFTRIKTENIFK